MDLIKTLWKKYWHIVFILYAPIYLSWFFALERANYPDYHLIHCFIDDLIPHVKYFIVPYLLWFPFIAACFIFLFFYSQKEFIRYAVASIAGMTICLIFYSIWPSAINMRPQNFSGTDVFSKLLMMIYSTDDSENVFPSIHCLNSYLSCIAVFKCGYFADKPVARRIARISVVVLTGLIVMSTVFLKQHSILDSLAAAVLVGVLYVIVYRPWKEQIN